MGTGTSLCERAEGEDAHHFHGLNRHDRPSFRCKEWESRKRMERKTVQMSPERKSGLVRKTLHMAAAALTTGVKGQRDQVSDGPCSSQSISTDKRPLEIL